MAPLKQQEIHEATKPVEPVERDDLGYIIHRHHNQQQQQSDPDAVVENPPAPALFNVILSNTFSYPVRFMTYMNETTYEARYAVFEPFESRKLTINLLTLRHIQEDPKARVIQASSN